MLEIYFAIQRSPEGAKVQIVSSGEQRIAEYFLKLRLEKNANVEKFPNFLIRCSRECTPIQIIRTSKQPSFGIDFL